MRYYPVPHSEIFFGGDRKNSCISSVFTFRLDRAFFCHRNESHSDEDDTADQDALKSPEVIIYIAASQQGIQARALTYMEIDR